MKISSFYKQAIRTVQFSIAALICSIVLNFGTAAPSLAAQVQLPTPHLAIFGWGDKEKAEGKVEQLIGKAQAKTGNKLQGTAKQINLSKAGDSMKDTANNLVDGAKKMIDN
jgi:hypothetical protein